MKIPIVSLKNSAYSVATLAFAFMTLQANAQDTTYVWQSSDGDPYGIAGTIVLDSPSSSAGTVADIVSVTLSDMGIYGPYIVNPSTDATEHASIPFTWTPTAITSMALTFSQSPFPHNFWQIAELPGSENSIIEAVPNSPYDESGSWVVESGGSVATPEPSSISLLMGSLVVAGGYAWRRRIQPCPQ